MGSGCTGRFAGFVLAMGIMVPGCGSPATDDAGTGDAAPAAEFDAALTAVLPPGITRDVYDEGRQLFEGCSVCHGEDGAGTQLGPPLREAAWMHIDGDAAEIAAVIRSGIDRPIRYSVPMPGTGDQLDEPQIRALAAYVRVLAAGHP